MRPEWLARLEQSFSRGFTAAHLEGRHADVRGRRPRRSPRRAGRPRRGGRRGAAARRRCASTAPAARRRRRAVYTVWGYDRAGAGSLRCSAGGPARRRARVVAAVCSERVSVKDRVFRLELRARSTPSPPTRWRAGRSPAPSRSRRVLDGRGGRAPAAALRADGRRGDGRGRARRWRRRAPPRSDADKARRAVGALGGTPYQLRRPRVRGRRRRVPRRRRPQGAAPARRWPSSTSGGWRRGGGLRAAAAAASRSPVAGAARRPSAVAARRSLRASRLGRALPAVVLRLRPGEEPVTCGARRRGLPRPAVRRRPRAVAAARRGARRRGLAVRVRSPEVLFDADGPGRRPWRPCDGTPSTRGTSRRWRGPRRSFSSTRCRG